MRFVINAYKRKSKGARALARMLGGRVVCVKVGDDYVRHGIAPPVANLKRRPENDFVITWGNGDAPKWYADLNDPDAVRLAANKLRAFDAMKAAGVSVPEYARHIRDVTWKGTTVVRHKLTGHSGEGIEVCEDTRNLPTAPLYVQYIKKEQEFRIHVGRRNGQATIIAVQRKARDRSVPNSSVNWQVRNHTNGFIFVRSDAHPDAGVLTEACNALAALELDFGAVDVIYNAKEGKAYVLEINTAPGLEGQTIEDYANFFG